MESLLQDIRYAVRLLYKNRGFSIAAILALALGIGANTAVFSVLNAVLLRALPYHDVERLFVFGTSLPNYIDLRTHLRSMDASAVWGSNFYTVPKGENAEQVLGAIVSPEFFPLLGTAELGRTIGAGEQQEQVAVISHDYFLSHFAGDPTVLGKTMTLNQRQFTIIGVMPRAFHYPNEEYKVWVPFEQAMAQTPEQAKNRQLRIFHAVAHLAPGMTFAQAQAEINIVVKTLQQQYPETDAGLRLTLTPLTEAIVGQVRRMLLVIAGTVAFVLLIACANVANLLLARATARMKEIAIRTVLGAARARIIRQLLTESLVLSLFGGFIGVWLAYLLIRLLRILNPGSLPLVDSVIVDGRVLLVTALLAILTALLFGLAPALLSAGRTSERTLAASTNYATLQGRRLRSAFITCEVALALVVLICAGLLTRSFVALVNVDRGFTSSGLFTVIVPLSRIADLNQRTSALQQVVAHVSSLPGVISVAGGSGLPAKTPQRGISFEVEGKPSDDTDARFSYFLIVTPGYFHTLGTRLLRGREFDERDTKSSPLVVVINRGLADRLFPGEDPLGKRLKLRNSDQSPDWRTIVGVAQKIRYLGLDDASDAQIYTPFAQTPFLWTYLMVRTGPGAPSLATLRSAIQEVNAALEPGQVQSEDELVSEAVAAPRFHTALLTAFALLALALTTIGIYGVVSYSVVQRTREIGIRMALGATRQKVLNMMLLDTGRFVMIGIAGGLVMSFFCTHLLASMLFGVRSTDADTFIVVSAILMLVALLAGVLPALPASKVEPLAALRYE